MTLYFHKSDRGGVKMSDWTEQYRGWIEAERNWLKKESDRIGVRESLWRQLRRCELGAIVASGLLVCFLSETIAEIFSAGVPVWAVLATGSLSVLSFIVFRYYSGMIVGVRTQIARVMEHNT